MRDQPIRNEYEFIGIWVPACSVGGADTKEATERFRAELLANHPKYVDLAKHVETALRDWRLCDDIHPRKVLTSIFSAAPSKEPISFAPMFSRKPDESWIVLFNPGGEDDKRPDDLIDPAHPSAAK